MAHSDPLPNDAMTRLGPATCPVCGAERKTPLPSPSVTGETRLSFLAYYTCGCILNENGAMVFPCCRAHEIALRLLTENGALQAQIRHLRARIGALENALRRPPMPPEVRDPAPAPRFTVYDPDDPEVVPYSETEVRMWESLLDAAH